MLWGGRFTGKDHMTFSIQKSPSLQIGSFLTLCFTPNRLPDGFCGGHGSQEFELVLDAVQPSEGLLVPSSLPFSDVTKPFHHFLIIPGTAKQTPPRC